MRSKIKYALLFLILVGGCQCDQYTKRLAERSLEHRPPMVLLSGFAELCYAENTGMAFSLLDDLPSAVRRPLLVGIPLLLTSIAAGCFWYFRAKPFFVLLPFALMLAGAAGNLLDRLQYGYVVDFIHLHARDRFHWPIFNVADTLLFVGGALLVLHHSRIRNERPAPQTDIDVER
jgi:signal peptidase II